MLIEVMLFGGFKKFSPPNEREIKWIKVEVSPLSFLGGEEEGERGERQNVKSNIMSVQRSKQLLKSL